MALRHFEWVEWRPQTLPPGRANLRSTTVRVQYTTTSRWGPLRIRNLKYVKLLRIAAAADIRSV